MHRYLLVIILFPIDCGSCTLTQRAKTSLKASNKARSADSGARVPTSHADSAGLARLPGVSPGAAPLFTVKSVSIAPAQPTGSAKVGNKRERQPTTQLVATASASSLIGALNGQDKSRASIAKCSDTGNDGSAARVATESKPAMEKTGPTPFSNPPADTTVVKKVIVMGLCRE